MGGAKIDFCRGTHGTLVRQAHCLLPLKGQFSSAKPAFYYR